jgi:hypothetical protein
VRPIAAALLVTLALAACGSEGRPRDTAPTSVVVYAATTDRLCSDLAGAIQRAFSDAPADPGAALARYARDVAEAGRRFAAVPPPPDLIAFHDSAIGHVREEAEKLHRVAADTKAGDTGAEERALRDHQGLLPRAIPPTLLAYAPTCRALSPREPATGAPA